MQNWSHYISKWFIFPIDIKMNSILLHDFVQNHFSHVLVFYAYKTILAKELTIPVTLELIILAFLLCPHYL